MACLIPAYGSIRKRYVNQNIFFYQYFEFEISCCFDARSFQTNKLRLRDEEKVNYSSSEDETEKASTTGVVAYKSSGSGVSTSTSGITYKGNYGDWYSLHLI